MRTKEDLLDYFSYNGHLDHCSSHSHFHINKVLTEVKSHILKDGRSVNSFIVVVNAPRRFRLIPD